MTTTHTTSTSATKQDLPPMDCPPSYATTGPSSEQHHQPGSSRTRVLEVHRAAESGTGMYIKDRYSGNVLYYAGHYISDRWPDVVLYGGYDSSGPRLAQADFITHSRDFSIFIGDRRYHEDHDGSSEPDMVRCAGGGLLQEPKQRFDATCKTTTEHGDIEQRRRFYWQKDRKFFDGVVSNATVVYRLVDEADERVVAVYDEGVKRAGSGGEKSLRGVLSFRQNLDEGGEIAALIVVLSLLERFRRHLRHKAFVGSPMSQIAKA